MVWLTFCIFIYCILHSILAESVLIGSLYYRWWYRLFYVTQSVLLLIPILWIYVCIEPVELLSFSLEFKIFLKFIQIGAVLFAVYASISYDNMYFLGVSQVKSRFKDGLKIFNDHQSLTIKGALKYVRHPYYFSGLLILWARPMYTKDMLVNIILSLYIVLGAFNEERKLLKQYGTAYIEYKNTVPMLLPWKINI